MIAHAVQGDRDGGQDSGPPLDHLPEVLREAAEELAQAAAVDVAVALLATMAVASSTIGTTRALSMGGGRPEALALWVAVVDGGGGGVERALQLLLELDGEGGPIVEDGALESIARRLRKGARGGALLVNRNLAPWLQLDGQRPRRGSREARRWIASWSGLPLDDGRGVEVAQASINIVGAIRPGELLHVLDRRGAGGRRLELLERMLLVAPSSRPTATGDARAVPPSRNRVEELLGRLGGIEHAGSSTGAPDPALLGLTPDARREWGRQVETLRREATGSSGLMEGLEARAASQAARLSTILALLETPAARTVDGLHVRGGWELARWALREAGRIAGAVGLVEQPTDGTRLLRWASRRAVRVIAKNHVVRSGPRPLRDPHRAQAAIEELRARGVGRWHYPPQPSTGRPRERVLQLAGEAVETQGHADGGAAPVPSPSPPSGEGA